MKIGLVSAIVVAALLLGSLFYWETRAPVAATPGLPPQTESAAPESPVVLSKEPAGPAETDRAAAAPPEIASPALAGDLASPGSPPVTAVTTSMNEIPSGGSEVFQDKYAEKDAQARRQALESLRSQLDGKDAKALTDQQIQETKLEIEWLMQHPG